MAPSMHNDHSELYGGPYRLQGANDPSFAAKKEIKRKVMTMIKAFNDKSGPNDPLEAINHKLKSLFESGPAAAFELYRQLDDCVARYFCEHHGNSVHFTICFCHLDSKEDFHQDGSDLWRSDKLTNSVILLLACDKDSMNMQQAIQFYSPSVHCPLKHDLIQHQPSASLTLAFRRAKTAAKDEGKTTILGCDLIDTAIYDPTRRGTPKQYTSFIHCFVLGIGPAGFAIWQAWGDSKSQPGSYSLDDYLRDGHGKLRCWDDAEQFVNDFEKLAKAKGAWTAKLNKLYKKLFLVDLNQVCEPNGDGLPITPRFKPWVRIQRIDDVTARRVHKFFCQHEQDAAPTRI
ncbi:hypothetical protein HJFPF1_05068 [Paramyrothecium foliicola]|nr:hypothetical protein HJFPF1_05068 [Paramyrothecium foliicola]